VDGVDVGLVVVVPAALVVRDGEQRRQSGVAGEAAPLREEIQGAGTSQQHQVHDATLADPVCLDLRPAGRSNLCNGAP
jgi:hypothetical protein